MPIRTLQKALPVILLALLIGVIAYGDKRNESGIPSWQTNGSYCSLHTQRVISSETSSLNRLLKKVHAHPLKKQRSDDSKKVSTPSKEFLTRNSSPKTARIADLMLGYTQVAFLHFPLSIKDSSVLPVNQRRSVLISAFLPGPRSPPAHI